MRPGIVTPLRFSMGDAAERATTTREWTLAVGFDGVSGWDSMRLAGQDSNLE